MTDKSILRYKLKLKRLLNETDESSLQELGTEKRKKYKNEILNKIKEKYQEDNLISMKRSVSTEDTNTEKDKNILLGTTENEEFNKKEDISIDIDTSSSDKEDSTNDDSSSSLENLNQEDLEDLANDTMLDVLQHIKDLREKMKKENPEKAKFIRKIYDYLVKGKDKIASDIIKETQKSDIITDS